MKLNKDELMNLITIVGQVSVPIASPEAEALKKLIDKMRKMVDETENEKKAR